MTMFDDPFDAPGLEPAKFRGPQPGEVLFEFVRESDRSHFRCELRYHGDVWGVEAQFWMNGELLIGRRFDTRALALQWAMVEREHIEKGNEE
jgi:hypothetical protein